MTYRLIFFLFLLFAVSARFAAGQAQNIDSAQDRAAPQFFNTLNDVPLMPGLYEMADEAVMFDKPGGRVAESAAYTETVEVQAIRSFYSNTLPQLGWKNAGENAFIRSGEVLKMQVDSTDGYRIVHFMVAPSEAE